MIEQSPTHYLRDDSNVIRYPRQEVISDGSVSRGTSGYGSNDTSAAPVTEPLETFGERLTALMRRGGLKNGDVATATGVHVKTVSYWRGNHQQPGDDDLDAIVRLLRQHGVETTRAYLRYGSEKGRLARAGPELVAGEADRDAFRAARIWLHDFSASLVRLDADDAMLRAATALVQAPEVAGFVRSLRPQASDFEAMRWMGRVVMRTLAAEIAKQQSPPDAPATKGAVYDPRTVQGVPDVSGEPEVLPNPREVVRPERKVVGRRRRGR